MNLVLIGYRGSGKSAVARQAAERLRRALVTMDTELERRLGATISDYVAAHGWPAFRAAETALARELGARDRLVIDTGGGVVERKENVSALRTNGKLVWLTAEPDVIAERLRSATDRPSLSGDQTFIEEIGEILERRLPLYRAAADAVIATDDRNLSAIVDDVVAAWKTLIQDAAGEEGPKPNM